MTEKTTEEIDKEIEEVKNRFNSVEENWLKRLDLEYRCQR